MYVFTLTWIVADKMGKLDAEVSNVDQHVWGWNEDRLGHTFKKVTYTTMWLPCMAKYDWLTIFTIYDMQWQHFWIGNNWIFPILLRIFTEESDATDARRNHQIHHLFKS